jgi:hypothetical protein
LFEESPLEESPLEESPLEESPLEESPLEESPLEESPLEESEAVPPLDKPEPPDTLADDVDSSIQFKNVFIITYI